MIYFLEELNTFDDTWKMTFYFVAAIAILLGLFWTLYKMYKHDNLKNSKLNENIIYNKSYDAIENMNVLPQKRHKDEVQLENYYDVYQNENRKQNIKNSYHENTVEESSVLKEPIIQTENKKESRVEGDIKFNDASLDNENVVKIEDKNILEVNYSIKDKDTKKNTYYNFSSNIESTGKNVVNSNNNKNKHSNNNKNKNKNNKDNYSNKKNYNKKKYNKAS